MRISRACLLSCAVYLLALAGCKPVDEIHTETITYEDREPIALRVAIMKRAEYVWFFRLAGPVDEVKEHQADFETFVKSVRFDKDEDHDPTWTAPKPWKKDPPGGPRFAGYRLNAKPKELEVTVTRLSAKGYSLMDNVHRWQRQVNVALAENVADLDALVKDEKLEGQDLSWVRLQGLAVHSVSKPPDPMDHAKKNLLPTIGINAKGKGALPFSYTPPKDWQKKPPRALILDAYEIRAGAASAETTVSVFGGDIGANIARWRDQVRLPKISDVEAARSAKEIKVAGLPAFYVDLANPQGPAGKNRVLGVIVPLDGQMWFIKMTGPLDLVGQQKNAFETFVQSFQKTAR